MIVVFIVGDDQDLLAKLRRDIALYAPSIHRELGTTRFNSISVPVLLDFIHPIRTAICSATQEIFAAMSNFLLLYELEKKDDESRINPIRLIILVISKRHIDKTVINPGSDI